MMQMDTGKDNTGTEPRLRAAGFVILHRLKRMCSLGRLLRPCILSEY